MESSHRRARAGVPVHHRTGGRHRGHQRQEHDHDPRRARWPKPRACARFVGGNLGTPASDAVGEGHTSSIVLEVSSFQLERAPRFTARTSALLLNVTEDHLDRYPELSPPTPTPRATLSSTRRGTTSRSSPRVTASARTQARRGRARLLRFGDDAPTTPWTASGVLETRHRCSASTSASRGCHGLHNLRERRGRHRRRARARICARGRSARALRAFQPLPHRMALAGRRSARRAASTTTRRGPTSGAAVTALLGLAEPRGVLIAGGRDKHGSYKPLVDALSLKGRAAGACWAKPPSASPRRPPGACRLLTPRTSTRPCASLTASQSRATPCCSAPPVRASTCSRATPTAASNSCRAVALALTRSESGRDRQSLLKTETIAAPWTWCWPRWWSLLLGFGVVMVYSASVDGSDGGVRGPAAFRDPASALRARCADC